MPFATSIWWEEAGQGAPLLLIMGQAFDCRMWRRAVPALAERYRVLTFDNRGIGQSRVPRERFSIADLAADALSVLDAAGAATAHVYGVSMGGLIAQELALTHPERVRSLILGCTGAQDGSYRPGGGGLRRLVPRWVVLHLFPGAVTRALYGTRPPPMGVREDLQLIGSTAAPGWVIAQQSSAIAAFESKRRVPGLRVPTLVLHGSEDRVVPVARGQELASLIPGARWCVLQHAGHNYLTEAAGEANGAVLRFLAEVDA